MTLQNLEKLVREKPALADVPIVVVNGQSISAKQALTILRAGGAMAQSVSAAMTAVGVDPPGFSEDDWKLTEDYYVMMARNARQPVIASFGYLPPLTYAQALQEIRSRSEVGMYLLQVRMANVGQIRAMVA